MQRFKNILVGVDLAVGDKLVGEELSDPTTAAVDRAIWLAELNSAQVHFFYTLDIGFQAQCMLEEDSSKGATILSKADEILKQLVSRARKQGISACYSVTFGKSWLELIRLVLRQEHDLVIVGTKDRGAVERLFIGTTGMKLLRKCPCPVWITHPPKATSHGAILVAHDLTEVGDLALNLGASMATLQDAPLHIVHVIEPVYVDTLGSMATMSLTDEDTLLHENLQVAEQHIEEQLREFQLPQSAQVHIASGMAATVLVEQIEREDIDLVVMGTVARSGVEGFLFGNTAERLLPQIKCSVIAVKPADFQSPIQLES